MVAAVYCSQIEFVLQELLCVKQREVVDLVWLCCLTLANLESVSVTFVALRLRVGIIEVVEDLDQTLCAEMDAELLGARSPGLLAQKD